MTSDLARLVDRAGLWPARVLWAIGPLAAGAAVTSLLDDRRDAGATTAALAVEIVVWALWFLILVATLAPSPAGLTAVRLVASTAVAGAAVIVAVDGIGVETIGGLLWALVTTGVVFLAPFGDRMINGSAYGSERRMALRPPAAVLLGPVQLSWAFVAAGLLGTAALVLAERWIAAAIVAVVGGVLGWAGTRIVHQLARRWLVFVPAGFVIRDPMHLVDAVLLRRNQVAALGPALATETGRIDLTGGARGLAVEVEVKEPTPITIRVDNQAENLEVTNILFTPTLPGAMLAEARIRGLKIGTPTEPG